MRLFLAVDLPGSFKTALTDLIRQLRGTHANVPGIRWSRPENLHVTTKFIGEWPEERLPEMKQAFTHLQHSGAFPVRLEGLGWFPNPHQPRIFWIGVNAGDPLANLARATDEASAQLGVAKETRPYRPHLTLARLESPSKEALSVLRQAVASLPASDFGEFTARDFHLYQSRTGGSGSLYIKLHTYSLEPAQ